MASTKRYRTKEAKPKIGRPPITERSTDQRTKHCAYFMTPEDHKIVDDFAKAAGFRGLGHLTTAIMERLVVGGFAPLCFAKVGLQLQAFSEKNGKPYTGGMYFGIRPLPALPDEHISDKESRSLAAKLIKETSV